MFSSFLNARWKCVFCNTFEFIIVIIDCSNPKPNRLFNIPKISFPNWFQFFDKSIIWYVYFLFYKIVGLSCFWIDFVSIFSHASTKIGLDFNCLWNFFFLINFLLKKLSRHYHMCSKEIYAIGKNMLHFCADLSSYPLFCHPWRKAMFLWCWDFWFWGKISILLFEID